MKEKINGKEVFVLLFSEKQQQFHNSYLGWVCSNENYGKKSGFIVLDEVFAGGDLEKLMRTFPDYYRSLDKYHNIDDVRSLLRRFKLNN
jgi:hypothetical protein